MTKIGQEIKVWNCKCVEGRTYAWSKRVSVGNRVGIVGNLAKKCSLREFKKSRKSRIFISLILFHEHVDKSLDCVRVAFTMKMWNQLAIAWKQFKQTGALWCSSSAMIVGLASLFISTFENDSNTGNDGIPPEDQPWKTMHAATGDPKKLLLQMDEILATKVKMAIPLKLKLGLPYRRQNIGSS